MKEDVRASTTQKDASLFLSNALSGLFINETGHVLATSHEEKTNILHYFGQLRTKQDSYSHIFDALTVVCGGQRLYIYHRH